MLTTPVIRCLRSQLPDVELHVLTKPSYRALYAANPNIDKVYELTPNLRELLKSLRRERYDFVVDLHKNWRSWRMRMALCRRYALPASPPP